MLRHIRPSACERLLVAICVLTSAASAAGAQSLTFTTFAGPAGGPGAADGVRYAARFNRPAGVASDSSGNIYVADARNHTIRKITAAGVVTTLAGSATVSGSSDGTGGAARFFAPFGIATDGANNIFVSDFQDNTVRKITPSGVVVTFAGAAGFDGSADGSGSAARFSSPAGVATDPAGNVYVADGGNSTIRKITPAGLVTTLAGSAQEQGSVDGTGSAARFDHPVGIATDSSGNVYVGDTDNYTIRKITPSGVVTTLAGSTGMYGTADGTGSAARFDAPGGLVTDREGNIYVSDTSNSTIRKITPAGVVTTLAGSPQQSGSADGAGAAARFSFPIGLAIDSASNVYVSELFNNTIRKITKPDVVTTLAGLPGISGAADGSRSSATFHRSSGVTTDGSGNVYVADSLNHTIRKITSAGIVSTVAGSAGLSGSADGTGSDARFDYPTGVAIDVSGNIYVADEFNQTIRKITPPGMVTTLAGSAGVLGFADGVGSDARFGEPAGVAIDRTGNIYVADSLNNKIRKITPAGAVTTLAGGGFGHSVDGTGSAASFDDPSGVATDDSGNVYVADSGSNTIRKITPAGVVTTLAGSVGPEGSADGIGSAARFAFPTGVAADNAGNVYVADSGNDTIRKVTPAGVVTTVAGAANIPGATDGTGSAARFSDPVGIAIDSSGNIYVADDLNDNIRLGRPALPDIATVGRNGIVGTLSQLATSPRTATGWQWRLIRQPSTSNATLSAASIENPTFIPDVADLYTFELTASNGVLTSITTVDLVVTDAPHRRRTVHH